MQFDKCEYLLNKWVICSLMNRRLPCYEKPKDCQKYYDRFMKECNGGKKEEEDKIFKCSIFSTH
jgi:hypothetical protein